MQAHSSIRALAAPEVAPSSSPERLDRPFSNLEILESSAGTALAYQGTQSTPGEAEAELTKRQRRRKRLFYAGLGGLLVVAVGVGIGVGIGWSAGVKKGHVPSNLPQYGSFQGFTGYHCEYGQGGVDTITEEPLCVDMGGRHAFEVGGQLSDQVVVVLYEQGGCVETTGEFSLWCPCWYGWDEWLFVLTDR